MPKGRPRDETAIDTAGNTNTADHSRVALGLRYEPSGRRRLPITVVWCPFGCGGWHLHRGNDGLRRAGCGRGEYRVRSRRPLAIAGRRAA